MQVPPAQAMLVLIDIQQGFDAPGWGWGPRNNPRAEGNAGRLVPAEEMHEVGLAELHGEFARVVDTDALLESLR